MSKSRRYRRISEHHNDDSNSQSYHGRLKEKQKLSQDIKQKYINQLQERNRKLKYEILKITEVLQQQKNKTTIKKEHKLIPNETTSQVLKKELSNVYKQIKNYERQINQLQTKQAGGLVTEKMARLQNIYKQKTAHLQKLKGQLSALTKNSIQNSKKLRNNAGKEELEGIMLKYNEQIKVLRQKVRNAEEKERKKMQNAKKQFDYIKKLQRELNENGVSMDQLEELKKNNIYNIIYQKMNSNEVNQSSIHQQHRDDSIKNRKHKEQIQDMTNDRYMELQNQIKLFRKLHLDYQKRLENLEKQRKNQESHSMANKRKLQQRQQQMEKVQQQINQLKLKMKKVNLKANFSQPVAESKSPTKKQFKTPTLPPRQKSPQKNQSEQTRLKYDQKGKVSDKGNRFTDRTIIGKVTNCHIIGIRVWTEKSTFALCGIQCIYKIDQLKRSGSEHIFRQVKKNCAENVMELDDGDYIKAVSGHLSSNNIIQYLVFISNKSAIGRFGVAKPSQKQFNFDIDEDQMPICMYGSICPTKEGKKQLTLIEQIGFEIIKDKQFTKDIE